MPEMAMIICPLEYSPAIFIILPQLNRNQMAEFYFQGH